MHPSDPDTTHAAAPGAIFMRDSGAPCPDPDAASAVTVRGMTDAENRLLVAAMRNTDLGGCIADSSPPLPQSCAEAAAHCLHLLESLLDDHGAELAWAAVEAYAAAARAETRAACAQAVRAMTLKYRDRMRGTEVEWLDRATDAIEALPLEAPR